MVQHSEQQQEFLEDFYNKTIPPVDGRVKERFATKSWKDILIKEGLSKEPRKLVTLPNIPLEGKVMAWPCYYLKISDTNTSGKSRGHGQLAHVTQGDLQTSPLVKVRSALAKKLDVAQQQLDILSNGTLQLVVVDGYRTVDTQDALFQKYVTWLQNRYPEKSLEQLSLDAQKMVSIAPRDPAILEKSPPPHSTGGSVDIVIVRKEHINVEDDHWLDAEDVVLNFGAEFDEMMHDIYADQRSATRFFETIENPTAEELEARNNRRLLHHLMTNAGFSSYHDEWWHYDFGNQFHAARVGDEAEFGFVGGIDAQGKITEDLQDEKIAYDYFAKLCPQVTDKFRADFGLMPMA